MIENQAVREIFDNYPREVLPQLLQLRQLIFEVAKERGLRDNIEETLKWGEPSYLSKKGSTVRLDWKESKPDRISLYFNCNTKLVDTFRAIFPDDLAFEDNRAIVLELGKELPVQELKTCILLALTYHTRKHLPLLGM